MLPSAIAGFSWQSILVWSPLSFEILLIAFFTAIVVSYFAHLVGFFFPQRNEYYRKVPAILLMSILSGLSNVIVIIMITSAIDSEVELKYLIFYYALTVSVYLLGRRYVQVNLIRFNRELVCDFRIKLIEKIFSTSYQK